MVRGPFMSLKNLISIGFMFSLAWCLLGSSLASAASPYQYQLYKNSENFGIVIFPKKHIYPELDNFVLSLKFKNVESGEAAMRFGNKKENTTYMMPAEVQEKHKIEKFVVLQVLNDKQSIMIGVYDEEFGLTLPSRVFQLEDVMENLPKTLDVFRQQLGQEKRSTMGPRPDKDIPFVIRTLGLNPVFSLGG